MRHGRVIVAALTLLGCSGENAPSSPHSPRTPGGPAFLWGMVIDDSGVCIRDVTVRVVGGHGVGRSAAQEPCTMWDYGGGFVFDGLTPGLPMTLRVSAPGYVDKDMPVTPKLGPQTALLIAPSR